MNLIRSLMNAVVAFISMPSTRDQMEQPRATTLTATTLEDNTPPLCTPLTCAYHQAPPRVNYDENPSVFGPILRGELPVLTLKETPLLLGFQDRTPRAPLHALIIPKQYIKSVFELNEKDIDLLGDMHDMAMDLIQTYYPKAAKREDYILCYHVPPFNSVDHLHLHVLAPASEMSWIYRFVKYLVGTRWCAGETDVIQRLQAGKKAVPYLFSG